jgi:hypothetical protein
MTACSGVRSSRPVRPFSFGFLHGLRVRPASVCGLERLATAFMRSPGWRFPGCMSEFSGLNPGRDVTIRFVDDRGTCLLLGGPAR